jgi:hypothetical protein
MLKEWKASDNKITQKLDDPMLDQDLAAVKANRGVKVTNAVTPEYEAYEDDDKHHERMPDMDNFDPETYDDYILAQVQLPRDDEHKLGTVIRRAKDGDDNPIGKQNRNSLLDTRIYEVELSDGQVLEYSANVVAENLYSHIGKEEKLARRRAQLHRSWYQEAGFGSASLLGCHPHPSLYELLFQAYPVEAELALGCSHHTFPDRSYPCLACVLDVYHQHGFVLMLLRGQLVRSVTTSPVDWRT